MCVFSLLYYFYINNSFPQFDLINFLKWVFIAPNNSLMPFPLGQLWFLNMYLVMFLLLPVFFYIANRGILTVIYLLSVFIFSIIQHEISFINVDTAFIGFAYKVIFYSFFLICGAVIYNGLHIINVKFFFVLLLLFCVSLFYYADGDITSAFISRSVVAILSTMSFALFLTVFKDVFYSIICGNLIIKNLLIFFHKHTFSIYLLHTLSILLVEKIFYMIGYTDKTYIYGVSKFILVLGMSSVFAIPFTDVTKRISLKVVNSFSL